MKISPLTLYADDDVTDGRESIAIPESMRKFYGSDLVMPPLVKGRATVSVNFVVRRDGVVNIPEDPGGKAINGGNTGDIAFMAILRATHDAVLVGSETLASEPHHLWTPSYIYREFGEELEAWRLSNGRSRYPTNIIISRSGMVRDPENLARKIPLSLDYPVFNTPELKTILVTTKEGASVLGDAVLSHSNVTLLTIISEEFERELLVVLLERFGITYLLVEGGPTVNGAFHAKGLVTDDFLTLAPGMAGRTQDSRRATLMMGHEFPPNAIPTPRLISVRRSDNHLLIRERYN